MLRSGGTLRIEGPDADPILFLHGAAGGAWSWRPQRAAFAATRKVCTWEARGHGTAPCVDDAGLRELYADAREGLGAVIDLVRRPAFVVGHSIGALLAMALACDVGAAVRALFLIDPVYLTRDGRGLVPASIGPFARALAAPLSRSYRTNGLVSRLFTRWAFERMFVDRERMESRGTTSACRYRSNIRACCARRSEPRAVSRSATMRLRLRSPRTSSKGRTASGVPPMRSSSKRCAGAWGPIFTMKPSAVRRTDSPTRPARRGERASDAFLGSIGGQEWSFSPTGIEFRERSGVFRGRRPAIRPGGVGIRMIHDQAAGHRRTRLGALRRCGSVRQRHFARAPRVYARIDRLEPRRLRRLARHVDVSVINKKARSDSPNTTRVTFRHSRAGNLNQTLIATTPSTGSNGYSFSVQRRYP